MKKPSLQNVFLTLTCLATLSWISCSGSDDVTETFPETCAAVQEAAVDSTGDRPENGTYTLYVGGDEAMPWEAYCYNMKRAEPTEFLTVNESDNFSQISTNVITETSFRRYRIDPIKLRIDLLDDTFATTTGDDILFPDERSYIPAGWAGFGDGSAFGVSTARAKIDLTGTPFAMDSSVSSDYFCTHDMGGDSSGSAIDIASNLKKVSLSATNTVPSLGITKTVADCDHFSIDDQLGSEDFAKGELKLQYIAE